MSRPRIIVAVVLALSCLSAAGCTQGDSPGNPRAGTAAVALTYQVAAHHWPQVYAHFDPSLASALPPQRMTQLWQGMESKFGGFDSASAVENRQDGPDQSNVVVACHFLKGTQFLVWTVKNGNLQFTGLHLAGGA